MTTIALEGNLVHYRDYDCEAISVGETDILDAVSIAYRERYAGKWAKTVDAGNDYGENTGYGRVRLTIEWLDEEGTE